MKYVFAVWRMVRLFLRELGDENAYQRHLNVHGLRHSRQEWQRFTDSRLESKFVRPRCC